MRRIETSVIVPNWNDRHHLGPCLAALQAQTYRDFEIVLVDNGSTDGSVDFVCETAQRAAGDFPPLSIVRNEENQGFAVGNNQGLAAAQGQLIATLNSDTVVDPNWLSTLVVAIQRDDRIGACASHMLLAARPGTLDSTGIDVDLTGTAWNRGYGRPDAPAGAPAEVFGACAGAALYRRVMLDDVGDFFDPTFFNSYEDTDLAWRARLRGWRCVYVPQARVLHVHSAVTSRHPASRAYYLGRNKVWTILKNYPTLPLLLFAPLILGYDAAAVAFHLLHGNIHPLRGRLAALRKLPRIWTARRGVQGRRVISWTALVRAMSWRPRWS
ncbi:MAG: glycosyltransferase family 2 protein [Chloroflexi bacterium]|nr:glycosyltransferase family 2 protein [Chloroflexota bacterium]